MTTNYLFNNTANFVVLPLAASGLLDWTLTTATVIDSEVYDAKTLDYNSSALTSDAFDGNILFHFVSNRILNGSITVKVYEDDVNTMASKVEVNADFIMQTALSLNAANTIFLIQANIFKRYFQLEVTPVGATNQEFTVTGQYAPSLTKDTSV